MKSLLFRSLAVLLVFVAAAAAMIWMDYRTFLQTPMQVPEEGKVYQVEPGSNFTRLVRDLADRGIIRKPTYLLWYGKLHANVENIGVGEYRLTPQTTPVDLVRKLEHGDVVQ